MSKKILKRDLTLEDCIFWNKNKTKNPITKYTLKSDSPILNEIIKQCTPLLNNTKNNTNTKNDNITNVKSISNIETSFNNNININNNSFLDTVIDNTKIDNKDIIKSNKKINTYYPNLDDDDFNIKISKLYEFYVHKIPEFNKINSLDDYEKTCNNLCNIDFDKMGFQYFVSHYISSRTPYRSLLIYHGVGVGKTCSSITIAESLLSNHNMTEEPLIWVITPKSLKSGFKQEIFSIIDNNDFSNIKNQCTGDIYLKLGNLLINSDDNKIKLKNLIKSRYKIFTYDEFASFIDNRNDNNITDKVIIVDEAHNIRLGSENNDEKRVYEALKNICKNGINNRLILLSATPIYNEPDDLLDLFNLLLLNDKREDKFKLPKTFYKNNKLDKDSIELIKKLSSNYISYIRGKNPFTFAKKISAHLNNVKCLENEYENDYMGKKINENELGWLKKIEDGIVISDLSIRQKEYIKNNKSDSSVLTDIHYMNIIYDKLKSSKGFNNFFIKDDNKNSLFTYKYDSKYLNALHQDNINLYSGKFKTLSNIINDSEGIILIHSQYIWGGIVPISIMLEHMGYNRYGCENIIKNNDNIKNGLSYCILTSDIDVMNNTKQDYLINKINNNKNINGDIIKIILITPVAGEGISFFNIRSIHLIEPWFHFNTIEQIIGRGIRNCRHQGLPISKRNVSVFMHASIDMDNKKKETVDINAYRISSRKLIQIQEINNIIRDNSLDCLLMRNINYFPKDLFKIKDFDIITSQGIKLKIELGDNENYNPKCIDNIKDEDLIMDGFRIQTFEHLIPSIKIKLNSLILNKIKNDEFYISFEEITDNIKFDKKIIYEGIKHSIYPNILIDGYTILLQNKGLHIIKIFNNNINKIKISFKNKDNSDNSLSSCDLNDLIKSNEEYINILNIYMGLNSKCFKEIIEKIIKNGDLNDTDKFIAKCLFKEGALISKKEIGIINHPNEYIGYFNIYNNKLEGFIYDKNKFRDINSDELNKLQKIRISINIPTNMAKESNDWGIIYPELVKKNNFSINKFKILQSGNNKGKGIICSSLDKKTHTDIINKFNSSVKKGTKEINCINIRNLLYLNNRLSLNPSIKPKL